MRETGLAEIRISVRKLVEFILRYGDIDNRCKAPPDNAMQEGSRIHRMIQRRMGAEYQAEVPLRYTLVTEHYILAVEGRADGIFRQEGMVTVDEIKGTYRELARMSAPMRLHVAQARCYAYFYSLQQELDAIRVRMTYCNLSTEELRYFYEDYRFEELEAWFQGVFSAWRKWADYSWNWQRVRQESIKGLEFPYPYREGQRDLAGNVYRTICHKRKLFLEAPTGVGKTISTLYPAIHAMGQGMGEKLFYLTAKTIARTVAEDTLWLLRGKGLRMKSVVLTAKEKICFMEKTECNPAYCPYARGHYDRVNDAVFDMLTSQESFGREIVEAYAHRYQVCPFEMCLDASLFADAVICDYNYLFDPHVYLKRFFAEGTRGDYLFLVDEAHNLLERGREMYSAVLRSGEFLELRRELKKTIVSEREKRYRKSALSGQMTLDMTDVMTQTSETLPAGGTGGRSILVKGGYAEKLVSHLGKCRKEWMAWKREGEVGQCRVVEDIGPFAQALDRLHIVMEEYLAQQEENQPSVRDMLLDFYFEVSHFRLIYGLLDENYIQYTQTGEDGSFLVKLFCVNPRENLKNCMLRGRSAILFSATFLPIQYYKKLLGGEAEDYEIYAQSVFDPARRMLLVAGDVTSRYARRSEEEYGRIACYIEEIVKNRHGNYLVFFPSHAFLKKVLEKYLERFSGVERECLVQGESMREADREAFLGRFQGGGPQEDMVLVGFCVLGGIFGEGIDLKRDSLIGVIIVGAGLPQVGGERELLQAYFDGLGEDGFDYAFRYPGMNKVLQAAGRVIRTAEDVGIIALLDERFLQYSYRRLFPREWGDFETVTVNTVAKKVERFWDEWL